MASFLQCLGGFLARPRVGHEDLFQRRLSDQFVLFHGPGHECRNLVKMAALQPVWQRIGRLALYQLIVFIHAALRVLFLFVTSGSFEVVEFISVTALIIMVAWSKSYRLEGFSLKTLEALMALANRPLWLSSLAILITSRVDVLLLPLFGVSAAGIGVYGFAYGILGAVILLPNSVQNVLMRPLFSGDIKGASILHRILWSYFAIGSGFFFAFLKTMPWLLNWMFPDQPTQQLIQFLAPTIPIIFMANILGLSLLVEKKDHHRALAQWIAAFANILFNCIFIAQLGIAGAALATSLSYFVLLISFTVAAWVSNSWNIRQHRLELAGIYAALVALCVYAFLIVRVQ